MCKLNKNGFTYIELAIATGMAGILAIIIFQLIQVHEKNERQVDFMIYMNEIFLEVEETLKSESSCMKLLKGILDKSNQKKCVVEGYYKEVDTTSYKIAGLLDQQEPLTVPSNYKGQGYEVGQFYGDVAISCLSIVQEKVSEIRGQHDPLETNYLLQINFAQKGKIQNVAKKVKYIPLQIKFAENEILNCSSRVLDLSDQPKFADASLIVIAKSESEESEFEGLTGKEGCEKIGRKCAWMERSLGNPPYDFDRYLDCYGEEINRGHIYLPCFNKIKAVSTETSSESLGTQVCRDYVVAYCGKRIDSE